MKFRNFNILLSFVAFLIIQGCSDTQLDDKFVRFPVDTVGFAQYDWQMDQVAEKIDKTYGVQIESMLTNAGVSPPDTWKSVISPHDDYAYAGPLYPAALQNVKAKTVFLIGVAHKARIMKLENQIIFDSFKAWQGPYGNIPVSDLREELIQALPHSLFQVNDSMHRIEHSLEALIPFLQRQNRALEIIPILVPYMSFERMNMIAIPLADAIQQATTKRNLIWGKDFAIVISNDAVHYGDQDWGGKNFARYGADSAGYDAAVHHDKEIMDLLSSTLKPDNIRQFCKLTVQEDNFKEYKWTWCGRYSIPFGLLTIFHLNHHQNEGPLTGIPLGYATSIDHKKLQVEELGLGVTAPAHIRHWVGYAAIGYK